MRIGYFLLGLAVACVLGIYPQSNAENLGKLRTHSQYLGDHTNVIDAYPR